MRYDDTLNNNAIAKQIKKPYYENKHKVYILDKKIGDVNGDNVSDTVFLVGEKGETPFFENIKVVIHDGRTKRRFLIGLDLNYSMAYDPWIFLGNFTESGAEEIMINLPVAGSGDLTYYYLISFLNNHVDFLLMPEQFTSLTQTLEVEVIYQDDYKVLITSKLLNQSHILDISDRKEVYEGYVYDQAGKLIKPQEGFMIYLPHLYPFQFNGSQPYQLESRQDIAGTSHADGLGELVTYWKYSDNEKTWILEPRMFNIMI